MRRDPNGAEAALPSASLVGAEFMGSGAVRLEFVAVSVGIGALPLLTPAGPGNMAPADVALVLAVGATLLWAASRGVQLRLPYLVGVGTMVIAGTLSASMGAWPRVGLLAVGPTSVLLVGLSGVSVQGVIMAFLYADGRPGLTSLALSGGLVLTVVLDLLLIPRFGVMGAAVAFCAAYLTTTVLLVVFFVRLTRSCKTRSIPSAPSMEKVSEGSRQ